MPEELGYWVIRSRWRNGAAEELAVQGDDGDALAAANALVAREDVDFVTLYWHVGAWPEMGDEVLPAGKEG